MKIVIPLLSFGRAGGSRVLSQLANHWVNAGHDVLFLTHKSSNKPYYPTTAEVKYFDNNGNLSEYNDTDYERPMLGIFNIRRILKKILDKISCDIILANHSLTAFPVAKTTNKAKKFYYVQAYEPDFFYPLNIKNRILRKVSKNSYKLGLNIIVNSTMYFNYHEIISDKYVPPGLDLKIFTPREKSKKEIIILGTIGRKEKHKGTGYIIDAFKQLSRLTDQKFELNIAFGEQELEKIEGVKVSRPDGDESLSDFYNNIDIYICAQTIQLNAIHYPVIESMACKTPVITTGYYPANDDNSYLIPIEDVDAISNAVIKFVDTSKEKNDTKVNRAYADVQQFDWEKVANKMLSYFLE